MKEDVNVKRKYIVLQLLKIVSGSSSSTGNGQATYSYYSQKNKKNDKSQEGSYKRMYLFRMANPASSAQDQGKVVYVIESHGVNERLWNCDILLRETVVTIGTFVLMRSPNSIENYLGDDVPIVVSSVPLLVLKKPCMNEVLVDTSLVEGVTQAFVLENCNIEILNSTPVVTKCSGVLCDRQNKLANLKNSKAL